MQHIPNLRSSRADATAHRWLPPNGPVELWTIDKQRDFRGGFAKRLSRGTSSLDPAVAADNFSFQLLQDLYEGLTIESASGQVLPGVASSWTVNPTGTKYTFQLKDSARWSNGKPVRAQEFVFAWRRVVDPTRGSQVSDYLRLIAGAPEIIAGRLPSSELGDTRQVMTCLSLSSSAQHPTCRKYLHTPHRSRSIRRLATITLPGILGLQRTIRTYQLATGYIC